MVVDFRDAQKLGYRGADGGRMDRALQDTEQRWADYENALAIDRARKRSLGGINDWTGETGQASPWIAQKADDLLKKRNKYYIGRAQEMMRPGDNRSVDEVAWELAYDDAGKTIADFGPRQTAYGTHEAQPYAGSGHHPQLQGADEATREAFAKDPRRRWDFAPHGRDAPYAGMRLGDSAVAMRVRPSAEAQGVYTPPSGPTEYNPKMVARPMVGFDTVKGQGKRVADADRALMNAVERTRSIFDVQGAGAWHKLYDGAPEKLNDSFYLRKFKEGRLPPEEMRRLQNIGKRYGVPDVDDVSEGVTMTDFMNTPPKLSSKQRREFADEVSSSYFDKIYRMKKDGDYLSNEGLWEQGVGSEAVVKDYKKFMESMPEGVYDAVNNNPAWAQGAIMRLAADAELGTGRPDVQRFYEIAATGKGWLDRLWAEIGKGTLPAIFGLAVGHHVFAQSAQKENES